ncbi:hypothetical protein ACQKMD_18105 [Viridibacillus sp. NPDC096237]|uniref:hypothetical protein n=1 Tax=Viridibacillus sp. NPDC096237 TaxID=3390721 RepID=UPI003D07010E
MRKILLLGILLTGSFVFYDNAHAAELGDTSDVQSVEQKEAETIYFNEDQDILVTDDVIIRKISDSPLINLSVLAAKDNYNNSGIATFGAGK